VTESTTSSYYDHKANELMETLLEFARTKMRLDKRFEKLVTPLSMDVDNEGKLDGEGTYDYIFDAF
jgi:hypothetical protein